MNWRKWLFQLVVLPIAHLPTWARYGFSDFAAFVLRHVVKYRRKVIDANLALAFPEKSSGERKRIRNDFYTHFCDVALEQTWLFAADADEVTAVCKITNPEVPARFAGHGGLVSVCAGHYGNYEMAAATLGITVPYPVCAIYTPLVNPYFDERIRETRGKYGLLLWPKNQTKHLIKDWLAKEETFAVGFATDQSPAAAAPKYWFPFLGEMTAHSRGVETYSRKHAAPVLFAWCDRVRRGVYTYTFRVVSEDASLEEPGAIIKRQARILEEVIRREPANWLWSHRRWKLSLKRDLHERDVVLDD